MVVGRDAADAPQVFVADLEQPRLTDQDEHHLRRVLRLRPGAALVAADGSGGWRPCRLADDGGLVPRADTEREAAPEKPVTVAFALTKGEKPDLVVQKLTELGVDRIVPFVAERSVVRWDDQKAARNLERFAVIARHAAMQCRRLHLPALGLPGIGVGSREGREGSPVSTASPAPAVPTFEQVAGLPGAAVADVGGRSPDATVSTVLVGPEGGWSPGERSRTLPGLTLGPHILRAETAAITAGALLVALRRDII